MGQGNLSHGVAQSRSCVSCATPEIAWILMQQAGEDAARHLVTNGKIRVGRSKVFSETGCALPKGTVLVRELGLASNQGCERKSATVERIFGSEFELLAATHWFEIGQSRRGSVVWDDSKDMSAIG